MSRRLLLPRERGLLRYAEIWQDGDDLLVVHSSRFADRYLRFRIRDIQALVLTEYPLWNGGVAFWLAGSLIPFLLVILLAPGGLKFLGVFPAIPLLWCLIYLGRGRRCRLVLHTAVSSVRLEAVRTMSRARVALPELYGLVESAQGRLSQDGTRIELAQAPEHALAPVKDSVLSSWILCGILAGHAAIAGSAIHLGKPNDTVLLTAFFLLTELMLAVIVLLRWRVAGPALAGFAALAVVGVLADGVRFSAGAAHAVGEFLAWIDSSGKLPMAGDLWVPREHLFPRAVGHGIAAAAGFLLLLVRRMR